jgi:hypothetical protein
VTQDPGCRIQDVGYKIQDPAPGIFYLASSYLYPASCLKKKNAFDKSGCGEGGIRTLGTGLSPYNGLANRPFRPLRHLSGGSKNSDLSVRFLQKPRFLFTIHQSSIQHPVSSIQHPASSLPHSARLLHNESKLIYANNFYSPSKQGSLIR